MDITRDATHTIVTITEGTFYTPLFYSHATIRKMIEDFRNGNRILHFD